ncbi:MAG: endopeptidase La [Oscillospiraceae bacterium]|nr:endopeptidase La [Oscillospiraceae bacterium]
MQEKKKSAQKLPVVPLRGTVVFPHMVMHFDVARPMSVQAVEEALRTDRKVFLTAQKDIFEEHPFKNDLYEMGVVAEIKQTVRQEEGIRILVECSYRAKIRSVEKLSGAEALLAEVRRIPEKKQETYDQMEMQALMRAIKSAYDRYSDLVPQLPRELFISVMCQENPVTLYEEIIFHTMLDFKAKQMILEENGLFPRMQLLHQVLMQEILVLETEKEIHDKTQERIDQGQREYFLREQLRVISEQLREETGEEMEDADSYQVKIQALKLPEESEKKLLKEAGRLRQMPPSSQEAYVISSYLDTCLELPWNTLSEENLDLKAVQEKLDQDHYGLQKVKERIVESLAVRVLNPELKGQILCLVGPPGVGKSSIGRSIADAIGRKFVRVSLGGIRDEADIRGHRKTYIGAMPGRIIAALNQAGTRNPLILLDELDKMGNDYKGDPSSAMLEVLDSEQNSTFRDHYVELPFDLSQVLFLATANTLDTIPEPLLDRMEVIEIASYTREEKFQIAKKHLVQKQVKAHGMKPVQCRVDDDAVYEIIDAYTKEAGVRHLERTIGTVCRKAAKTIAIGDAKRVSVKTKDLKSYLGIAKYLPDAQNKQNAVGLVNGLAWTSVGGVLMPLEAIVLNGKGVIEITGSLGDVMQESARIAVSYTRSIAKEWGISEDFYQKKDLHIHAPEGAVPKDGPSAGVTMATALLSALTGIPVRADVAMTGEITLHGKVMPIGGLREKSMAAYKAGIRTVIIPAENQADLEEIDEIVKNQIEFIPVQNLSEVFAVALKKPEEKSNGKKKGKKKKHSEIPEISDQQIVHV